MSKTKNYTVERNLVKNVEDSITEYLTENGYVSSVQKGKGFCEWLLFNIFELTEDEVTRGTEIGGKFDNGIDAIFEYNGELHVLQSKYLSSHSIDSVHRFSADCKRLCTEEPITDRDSVKELCLKVRNAYGENEPINCFYITNSDMGVWEKQNLDTSRKNLGEDFRNLTFDFYDFEKIVENIDMKTGSLPKKIKDTALKIKLEENLPTFETTIVARVKTIEFAHFVNEGGNLLFHSNIRNYLRSTKINKGIKKTLQEEPENFWYYNNGVTVVCDKFKQVKVNEFEITAPQIVNGCQTAKTIGDFYKHKTRNELTTLEHKGYLLVKIIRTKKNTDENQKKQLRDDITRFTNSQNAVRGLDFYALDDFQKDLRKRFEKLGYYYEIQRGAFITLDIVKRKSYKGHSDYEYLLAGDNRACSKSRLFSSKIKMHP